MSHFFCVYQAAYVLNVLGKWCNVAWNVSVFALRYSLDEKVVDLAFTESIAYISNFSMLFVCLFKHLNFGFGCKEWQFSTVAPCRLRGCENRPAPFPGRMS